MKYRIIIYLVSGIIISLIIFFSSPDSLKFEGFIASKKCQRESRALDIQLQGTVIRVYEDSNYNNQRILILSKPNGEREKSIILNGDHSGLYETLKKGDYVNKEKESLDVLVSGKSNSYTKTLDYQCHKDRK